MTDEAPMHPRERAARIPAGAPVRWRQLELDAFRRHPGILGEIAPVDRLAALSPPLGVGILLATLGAPLLGAVSALSLLITADARVRADGIAFVAGCFAFALIATAVFATWDRSLSRGHSVALLAVGAVAAAASVRTLAMDGASWWWALPPALFALLGAVELGVAWLRPPPPTRRGRVQQRVARLTGAERIRIEAELRDAIELLVARGVIARSEGDWALGADLGMLPVRMTERRPRSAPIVAA